MHLSKIGILQCMSQYHITKEYVFPEYDIGSLAIGTRRFEGNSFFKTSGNIYSVTEPLIRERALKYTALNTLRLVYILFVV